MEPIAAIVGAGMTKFGDFPTKSIKEIFSEAYQEMKNSVDRGFDPKRIEAAFIGSLSCGSGFQLGQSGPLLMGFVGLSHVPTTHVENACGSGGFALYSAVNAIAAGKYDVVLAAGYEKMNDVSSTKRKYWLGVSGDTEFERLAGSTFAGIYAIMANRYMHEYGLKHEHLLMAAIKNHNNAMDNPKAQFRNPLDMETALKGVPVAYPFNIWDCSSTTDGAAIVMVVNPKIAREFTDRPVYIIGSAVGGDQLAIHDRPTFCGLAAARRAAQQAYAQAGIGPQDIDMAEVHDCFTIAEILSYADLGFCEEGQAGRLLEEGATLRTGRIPVNVSGGLKAKGHPLGATGISQAYEIFNQMRGTAQNPVRQLPDVEFAISHNVGGSGGAVAVHIYWRG
ncbi:MAG: thiolase domain-containing protein [Firmicutes bacterium]|nr:thiolase domain-containing protein [Bacillota bacterium]